MITAHRYAGEAELPAAERKVFAANRASLERLAKRQPVQTVVYLTEDGDPAVPDKAADYAFFLVKNHPFVDGNTRTAEAAMLVFLDPC